MSELAKNPGMLASNKLKQLEQEIAATRQKLQACRKKPFQKLQEPVDDRYLVNLVKHIQAKNYAQIDYSEPEFTRYLFAALRLGKITQDEMLTAKLMYESLIAFNQGKVPENSQAQFSRFNLGDEQGPYDPSQDIPYWTPENSEKLQASNEDKQYYTINLPHQVAVKYLFQCLQDEKISEQLGRYLLAYINSKKCSQQQKDKAIAAVCAFNSSDNDQDVRKRKANYLQQFIRQHESEDVNYFIDNTGYPNMLDEEVPEYISQLADSMFMASFDR